MVLQSSLDQWSDVTAGYYLRLLFLCHRIRKSYKRIVISNLMKKKNHSSIVYG